MSKDKSDSSPPHHIISLIPPDSPLRCIFRRLSSPDSHLRLDRRHRNQSKCVAQFFTARASGPGSLIEGTVNRYGVWGKCVIRTAKILVANTDSSSTLARASGYLIFTFAFTLTPDLRPLSPLNRASLFPSVSDGRTHWLFRHCPRSSRSNYPIIIHVYTILSRGIFRRNCGLFIGNSLPQRGYY